MSDFDALIPNPLMTDRQYDRFYHLDLTELRDTELQDEIDFLRPLLWGIPDDHWLRERVNKLEAEIVKRRGYIRADFAKQLKPKRAEGVKL